jgi:ADP-ribose pyrophosphatase YjhB (NUDIX family)
MMKSSKLIAVRRGRVLLVRRRKDKTWTLPGGRRKKTGESAKACLRRELGEELPRLRVRKAARWRKLGRGRAKNRARNHAIFTAAKVGGQLLIGDEREIDRVKWLKPSRVRLSRTTRLICQVFLVKRRSS